MWRRRPMGICCGLWPLTTVRWAQPHPESILCRPGWRVDRSGVEPVWYGMEPVEVSGVNPSMAFHGRLRFGV